MGRKKLRRKRKPWSKKERSFSGEILEPRILLSASWVTGTAGDDVMTGTANHDRIDGQSVRMPFPPEVPLLADPTSRH